MKFTMQPLRAALALGFVLTAGLVSGCDVNAKIDISNEKSGTFAFMNPVIRTPMAGRPTAGYFDFNYNYNVPIGSFRLRHPHSNALRCTTVSQTAG